MKSLPKALKSANKNQTDFTYFYYMERTFNGKKQRRSITK